MSTIGVPTKFQLFIRGQFQSLLEPSPDLHQGIFPRAVSAFALAQGPRPQADSKESLPNVEDNAHDLVVILPLEGLANGGKLGV
jgi:hypothetical protein